MCVMDNTSTTQMSHAYQCNLMNPSKSDIYEVWKYISNAVKTCFKLLLRDMPQAQHDMQRCW